MKTLYAQHFDRKNFDVKPPLSEKVCVVFETDVPWDDEHIEAFEQEMWDALFEQYPLWQCPYHQGNPPPNVSERFRHGFCTPMMSGPLVKLVGAPVATGGGEAGATKGEVTA